MRSRGVARVVTIVVACSLACAATASATEIGANDDTGKFAPDAGAAFYREMAAAGLQEAVVTVRWVPSDPVGLARPPAARPDGRGGALGGTRRRLRHVSVSAARGRGRPRATRRVRRLARRARPPVSRRPRVRRRQRAEPAGLLAAAVQPRRAGVRGVVRAVPRGGLRRAEGRRPDADRRRRRALAPRERPAVRARATSRPRPSGSSQPSARGTARAAGPGR